MCASFVLCYVMLCYMLCTLVSVGRLKHVDARSHEHQMWIGLCTGKCDGKMAVFGMLHVGIVRVDVYFGLWLCWCVCFGVCGCVCVEMCGVWVC
jgi:hypothetical protein